MTGIREQMQRTRQRLSNEALGVSFVVAMLLHGVLFLALPREFKLPPSAASKPRPVTMVKLSKADLDRALKPPQTRNEPAVVRKEREKLLPEDKKLSEDEKVDLKNKQVVDVAPTPDDKPPEDTRYVSEHNTHVEKETRSRYQSKDYQRPAPVPVHGEFRDRRAPSADKAPKVAMTTPDEPVKSKPAREKIEEEKQAAPVEIPDQPLRMPLRLKLDPLLGMLPNQGARPRYHGTGEKFSVPDEVAPDAKRAVAAQEASEGDAAPRPADLAPSRDVLAMIAGAPSNDHLPELEEGDATLLNSREFRFASFFNRVKRSVSQHWDPSTVYRLRDPRGNIYGYKDRLTVVKVTLNPTGDLNDVAVERASGVDFLDIEALRAFRSAEPFPNPPRGLIEDGKITFQFAFYVEVSSSPAIHFFRYGPQEGEE